MKKIYFIVPIILIIIGIVSISNAFRTTPEMELSIKSLGDKEPIENSIVIVKYYASRIFALDTSSVVIKQEIYSPNLDGNIKIDRDFIFSFFHPLKWVTIEVTHPYFYEQSFNIEKDKFTSNTGVVNNLLLEPIESNNFENFSTMDIIKLGDHMLRSISYYKYTYEMNFLIIPIDETLNKFESIIKQLPESYIDINNKYERAKEGMDKYR